MSEVNAMNLFLNKTECRYIVLSANRAHRNYTVLVCREGKRFKWFEVVTMNQQETEDLIFRGKVYNFDKDGKSDIQQLLFFNEVGNLPKEEVKALYWSDINYVSDSNHIYYVIFKVEKDNVTIEYATMLAISRHLDGGYIPLNFTIEHRRDSYASYKVVKNDKRY